MKGQFIIIDIRNMDFMKNQEGQHYADRFEVPHKEEAEQYYNDTFGNAK